MKNKPPILDPLSNSIFHPTFTEARRDGQSQFLVSGIHQIYDQRNQNGRIYPRTLWENILRPGHRVQTRLENRQLLGLLGHPSDGEMDLERASHVTTKLEIAPNGVINGISEILPTPKGEVAKTLYKSDVRLGISSRGFGDSHVQEDAEGGRAEYLEDDFDLHGFDFVLDPSVATAYPRVTSEAVERDIHCYNDLFCAVETRMRAYKEGRADPEELQAYQGILHEFTGQAKPLTFYREEGGRLSPNGDLVERANELSSRLGSTLSTGIEDQQHHRDHIEINTTESQDGGSDMDGDTAARLEQKLEEVGTKKDEQANELRTQIESLKRANAQLSRRLAAAEALMNASTRQLQEHKGALMAAQRLISAGMQSARSFRVRGARAEARANKASKLLGLSVHKLAEDRRRGLETYRRQLANRLPNRVESYKALQHGRNFRECNEIFLTLRKVQGGSTKQESGAPRGRRPSTRRVRRRVVTEDRTLPTRADSSSTTARRNPAGEAKKPVKQEQRIVRGMIQRLSGK